MVYNTKERLQFLRNGINKTDSRSFYLQSVISGIDYAVDSYSSSEIRESTTTDNTYGDSRLTGEIPEQVSSFLSNIRQFRAFHYGVRVPS